MYDPSSSAALAARYEIVVHYYENGNVQMNYAHSEDLPLSVVDTQDSAAIAKTLTRAVEKAEGEIAEGISKQVEELGGDAFRAMRRMLPVTKQKVNWDKVGPRRQAGRQAFDACSTRSDVHLFLALTMLPL